MSEEQPAKVGARGGGHEGGKRARQKGVLPSGEDVVGEQHTGQG